MTISSSAILGYVQYLKPATGSGHFQISGFGLYRMRIAVPTFHRDDVLSSPLHVPSHRAHINSNMTETNPSHGDLLADRLRRLDICPKLEPSDQLTMSVILPISHKPPYEYYGYGFRPASGQLIKRMNLTAGEAALQGLGVRENLLGCGT